MSRNIFGWSYPPGAATDPFAPYNQTSEPYDLAPHLKGLDSIKAYWDEDDRIYVQDDKGTDLATITHPWNDELSDKANFAAAAKVVEAWFDPDPKLRKKIERMIEANRRKHTKNKKRPTFEEFWAELNTPEGDFEWRPDEAGDWTPYYCDDCDTWHKTAEAIDIGRKEGKRFVEIRTVDQDGDWDYDTSYEEGEGIEAWACIYDLHLGQGSLDEHFRGWAEYHLWCMKHPGKDPCEDFFKDNDKSPASHLKAAEDYAIYLDPAALRRKYRIKRKRK